MLRGADLTDKLPSPPAGYVTTNDVTNTCCVIASEMPLIQTDYKWHTITPVRSLFPDEICREVPVCTARATRFLSQPVTSVVGNGADDVDRSPAKRYQCPWEWDNSVDVALSLEALCLERPRKRLRTIPRVTEENADEEGSIDQNGDADQEEGTDAKCTDQGENAVQDESTAQSQERNTGLEWDSGEERSTGQKCSADNEGNPIQTESVDEKRWPLQMDAKCFEAGPEKAEACAAACVIAPGDFHPGDKQLIDDTEVSSSTSQKCRQSQLNIAGKRMGLDLWIDRVNEAPDSGAEHDFAMFLSQQMANTRISDLRVFPASQPAGANGFNKSSSHTTNHLSQDSSYQSPSPHPASAQCLNGCESFLNDSPAAMCANIPEPSPPDHTDSPIGSRNPSPSPESGRADPVSPRTVSHLAEVVSAALAAQCPSREPGLRPSHAERGWSPGEPRSPGPSESGSADGRYAGSQIRYSQADTVPCSPNGRPDFLTRVFSGRTESEAASLAGADTQLSCQTAEEMDPSSRAEIEPNVSTIVPNVSTPILSIRPSSPRIEDARFSETGADEPTSVIPPSSAETQQSLLGREERALSLSAGGRDESGSDSATHRSDQSGLSGYIGRLVDGLEGSPPSRQGRDTADATGEPLLGVGGARTISGEIPYAGEQFPPTESEEPSPRSPIPPLCHEQRLQLLLASGLDTVSDRGAAAHATPTASQEVEIVAGLGPSAGSAVSASVTVSRPTGERSGPAQSTQRDPLTPPAAALEDGLGTCGLSPVLEEEEPSPSVAAVSEFNTDQSRSETDSDVLNDARLLSLTADSSSDLPAVAAASSSYPPALAAASSSDPPAPAAAPAPAAPVADFQGSAITGDQGRTSHREEAQSSDESDGVRETRTESDQSCGYVTDECAGDLFSGESESDYSCSPSDTESDRADIVPPVPADSLSRPSGGASVPRDSSAASRCVLAGSARDDESPAVAEATAPLDLSPFRPCVATDPAPAAAVQPAALCSEQPLDETKCTIPVNVNASPGTDAGHSSPGTNTDSPACGQGSPAGDPADREPPSPSLSLGSGSVASGGRSPARPAAAMPDSPGSEVGSEGLAASRSSEDLFLGGAGPPSPLAAEEGLPVCATQPFRPSLGLGPAGGDTEDAEHTNDAPYVLDTDTGRSFAGSGGQVPAAEAAVPSEAGCGPTPAASGNCGTGTDDTGSSGSHRQHQAAALTPADLRNSAAHHGRGVGSGSDGPMSPSITGPEDRSPVAADTRQQILLARAATVPPCAVSECAAAPRLGTAGSVARSAAEGAALPPGGRGGGSTACFPSRPGLVAERAPADHSAFRPAGGGSDSAPRQPAEAATPEPDGADTALGLSADGCGGGAGPAEPPEGARMPPPLPSPAARTRTIRVGLSRRALLRPLHRRPNN
ncbi:hypothetical protein FJT64_014794 [Amphibalanus amphitrite]|uniref:Uncharacterized protein n=1 Tax=Amphibalanus amphitrite TaxID=1232801 RepID=A0A6A4V7R5_AMPAM|nr:hypothetical protein FJT64_014794 [Amphibalanus amphitrite]